MCSKTISTRTQRIFDTHSNCTPFVAQLGNIYIRCGNIRHNDHAAVSFNNKLNISPEEAK